MNRKTTMTLVAVLALAGWCRAEETVEIGDELIVNGGLEGEYKQHATYSYPADWHGNIFGQAEGRYVREIENPHSGQSAIKIECDALPAGGISFYQTDRVVRFEPGRKYTLSAWIRSDTDAEKVYLSVRDCEQLTKIITATRGWRKYTIEKTYTGAPGSDFVALYYFATRPGNVVFDDIRLQVVEDEEGARAMSRNLLPNSGMMVSGSGFAPDWWNWYGGTDRDDWPACWQPVDDHYIPGTRSIKLSQGAGLLTSYLRRMKLAQGTPFTLSAYLKSAAPDTKLEMHIGGWEGTNQARQITVGTAWKRYHVTGTAEQDVGRPFMYMRLTGSGPLWVNAPQLELGDSPTEWRPREQDRAQANGTAADNPRRKQAIPRLDCPLVETAPIIDGMFQDDAWTKAAATGSFSLLQRAEEDGGWGGQGGDRAEPGTKASICRDADKLYLAVHCHEPTARLIARESPHDDYGVLADDCVEVFVSAHADGSAYRHFAVNAQGSRFDAQGFERSFNPEWDCTARGEGDSWSVEIAIPFSSLRAAPGDPLRINLARYRAQRNGAEQYSCLAPVRNGFHDVERFCYLGPTDESAFDHLTRHAQPDGELIAYLDRSFYTTEPQAMLFVEAPEGSAVGFTLDGTAREAPLPASGLIPIDLASLPVGQHPLALSVGGQQVALVVTKLPEQANAVKIDRLHRVLLVDDSPFVPHGIIGGMHESQWRAWYQRQTPDLPGREIFELHAEMGFNCAYYMLHQPFMTEEAEAKLGVVMDNAESLGMRIIIYYKSYDYEDDRQKWEAELLDVVARHKDHPALLAWWVYDEPLLRQIEWLEGLCDSVGQADPYHPVFVNWCDRGHGWTSRMTEVTGDVCLLDGYYINCFEQSSAQAWSTIGGHCRDMRAEAMKTGKLVGYINGLHGWHSAIREHSPAEQRFVTYVSLIGGAKMLLYFGGPYTMNMELRETFPSLSHELATLTPIVANPEVRQRVACDNRGIDYTAYAAPDGLYVITLNTGANDERATFRIRGAAGEVVVLFEGRTRQLDGGEFQDTFEPLERHVYRITGADSYET